MRLQVTERPQRRQLGFPSQPRVLSHHSHRVTAVNDEQIQHGRSLWIETAFRAREIELTQRLMNEHRPAAGPDQPRNWRAPAVCSQAVAALATAHFVLVAPPIKLWPTFAKAEHWSITQIEKDGSSLLIDAKFLNQSLGFVCDGYTQGLAFNLHGKIVQTDALLLPKSGETSGRTHAGLVEQNSIISDRFVFDRDHADANRVRAN